MILGYIISGEDNDSQMFDGDDNNLPICKICGYINDFEYISPIFELKRKKYDISSTYDNRTIVSKRFRKYVEMQNFSGLEFKEIFNYSDYYVFFVRNIMQFDTQKRKLKYDKYCDECGNYESVTPSLPLVIKDLDKPLKEGIFATDIHFASGNEKSPVMFVGIDTYKDMKKEKFKGIHFLKFDTELSVPWE